MATLGSKSTDGRLSFVKYVEQNKRFAEIEFEVEKDKEAYLYKKVGAKNLKASPKPYKAGTKINIITPKMIVIEDKRYVDVKIKGAGSGLMLINQIRKPTGGNGTQYEDEVVDLINKVIKDNGAPIDIKLKGDSVLYKNIAFAVKVDTQLKQKAGVKGDPKCDIILCVDDKKPLDKSSIFISHKKEGGPEAFQQYGGLSESAGSVINKNPIVQAFLALVAESIGEGDKLNAPIVGYFDDKTLMNQSIYGPDFGKPFSLEHTQLIGQGKPKLTPMNNGKYYQLDFTSHMSLSGDLSHFSGGYLPVLAATFRAGRGFNYKGKRYVGARVGIYPFKLVGTRAGVVTYKI